MTLGLGSHRYRLLSEHFQACSDLSAEERESYLAGPRIADDEIREELRSLLKFHSANLEIPTPRPAVRPEYIP